MLRRAGLVLISMLLTGCVAVGYVLSGIGVGAGMVDRALLKAEVEALRQRVGVLEPAPTAWEQFRRQEWALEVSQRAVVPLRGDVSSVPLISP